MYTIEDEIIFESPVASGKYFVGWFTLAEDGTLINKIEKGSIGNITLYSRYISFDSNGGSDVVYSGVSINNNKINKPNSPEKDYYTFEDWYTDEGLTNKYYFTIPSKNLTLYAKWKATPFDIIYVLDDGENAKSNVSSYTIEDKVVFADANKEGYTFVGWFTDKDFTSTVVEELPIGTHGQITLYANFSIKKYTISFESNGGTSVSAITQNYASTVTAPESPARNGYEFAGWYSDASLNRKYTFSTIPSKDITLYAKWNLVTYDITYNLNGGSNDSSNPKTYNVNSADITLKTASKKGYAFDGWYTDAEYKNGISVIKKGSYGDLELFAKWTVIEYSITYITPTSATNTNNTVYTVETDVTELAKATLKGYTFIGWYSDEKYTASVITIGGGEIGNKTLYAKFTVNTYNVYLDGTEESEYVVSFNLNGADGNVSAQTVNEKNTLKYPTIPERNGYVFGGWYETAECDGELYDFTAQITKDITLYAKWFELGSVKPINMNGTATITINGKQESVFLFVPTTSGNVTITTVGSLDTFGMLKNENGVILAQDDDTGSDENFQILYNVTAGKPYYIVVRSFGTVSGNATLSLTGKTEVAAGGFVVTPTKTKLTYDAVFTLIAPAAREGYTFLGYVDIDGKYYTDRKGASIVKWDKDSDAVLYSAWEKAVYTVTFDTSGGSEIAPITLAYGARLDINEYVTTRSGYSFDCWYLDDDVFEATTMPDHSITLEAAWKKYSVGTIKIDDTKTAISYKDTITAELFGVYAIDTDGKYVDFTITVNNVAVSEYTLTAGETVTVKFVAGNKQKTVTAKVYGEPTLDYTASDYVNVPDGLVASSFSASGTDTFGNATTIRVSVVGEYKAGDIVTVLIESVDAAGNITSATVQNVKAYGKPVVTYNENKTAIKVTDTINAELFNATSTDSFGEALTVTVTKYSGTQSAGNTVTVKFTVTDSKGNTTTFTVSGIKVYGTPTISNATKTEFKEDVSDVISPETLGITAKDTFGNALDISLSVKSGERLGGNTMVYTATATDAAGNIATKDITVKIYGTPTITVGRTDIKVTENPIENSSVLKATAKDSFGNALSVSVALKSGTFASGNEVTYIITATDKLGNVATVDTPSVKVYSVDDISFKYSKRAADMIKLSSKGEEFFASATDAFGNSCEITVQAVSGYTLTAGKVINIYLVATDKAGNAVKSDLIENISIYDTPVMDVASAFIYEDTDLDTYITVTDSFGEELSFDLGVEGLQTVGNTVWVTVSATDDVGNILNEKFEFTVIESYQSPVEYGGLTYTLNSDKTAYTVTAYDGTTANVTILDFIGSIPVTVINSGVFNGNSILSKIVIGKNITSIGNSAFYGCSKLISITIPDSVISIGSSAFGGCSSLTSVIIGNGVTSIGDSAFYGCPIVTATMPTRFIADIPHGKLAIVILTSGNTIRACAFYNCSSLTSITISDSVTYIGDEAFYNCRGLTSVTIGNSVTSIGNRAFLYCDSLTSITIPDSVTYIGDEAFGVCSSLTSVTMPKSVTSIGENAFSSCRNLTSITIPDSVTSIGINAFYNCDKLVEVINYSRLDITKRSTGNGYVGYYALNIKTEGTSNIVNKDGYLFYTYGNVNYLLGYVGSDTALVLPDNYNGQNYEIYKNAFYCCSSLTSVTIGNSITSIESDAFYRCSSLTSVTIGNSVTSIGSAVFYDCSSLTSITFMDTSTWYKTTSSSDWKRKTNGTQTSVTNSSANAINFKSNYYWYKI